MSKKLFCIVGKSGAGKTTVTDLICACTGMKSVQSMTTRPMRYPGEKGHTFVSPEEFHRYDHVAYTMFDGNEYGVPAEMLDESDFYVIDIDGVKTLRERYHGKQLVVVYLDIAPEVAAIRMNARGDAVEKIIKRIRNDKTMFADIEGLKPDYIINAGQDLVNVVSSLMDIVRKENA